MLNDKFDTQPCSIGTVIVSQNEIVQAEISRYKSVPSSEKPLAWWNLQQLSFPNGSKVSWHSCYTICALIQHSWEHRECKTINTLSGQNMLTN